MKNFETSHPFLPAFGIGRPAGSALRSACWTLALLTPLLGAPSPAQSPPAVQIGDLTCREVLSPFDLGLERPVIAFYRPPGSEGRWITLAWDTLMRDDQSLRLPVSEVPAYMAFRSWVVEYSRVERETLDGELSDVYVLQVATEGGDMNDTEEVRIHRYNVPVHWQLHTYSRESRRYNQPYIGHSAIVDLREHYFERTTYCRW